MTATLAAVGIGLVLLASGSEARSEASKIPYARFPLTDQQLESALASGATLDPDDVALQFRASSDRIRGFQMDGVDERLGHFLHGSGSRNRTTGFIVEVYTPYSWIQREAALRAEETKKTNVADVTDGMREPFLRVLCHPNTPVVPQPGVLGTEVVRVSLRSTNKKDPQILEPVRTERLAQPVRVSGTTVTDFGPLLAYFSLKDVAKLAELDKKREFYIDIVSAEDEEKDFKVKTKHFSKLP